MDQNKLPPYPCQDELGNLPVSTVGLRSSGLKTFTATQTLEDIERRGSPVCCELCLKCLATVTTKAVPYHEKRD